MHLNRTHTFRQLILTNLSLFLMVAPVLTASAFSAAEPPAGETARFELKVKPDPQKKDPGNFLMELKRLGSEADTEPVGEVMVWWILPGGRKTSISMKQVSDDVWADRISLAEASGENRLSVVILGKAKGGTLGQTTELLYEFKLPEMNLTKIKGSKPENKPSEKAAPVPGPELPASVVHVGKAAWSMPVVVILFSTANLFLLLPGLLLFKFFKRLSSVRSGRGLLSEASAQTLFGKIFSGSGMIDRQSGAPLSWDRENVNDATERPPVYQEIFEATMTYPVNNQVAEKEAATKSLSAGDFKKMTTEDLVDMVQDAIEKMEQGKLREDVKELVKAAEKELASREQERISKKSAPKVTAKQPAAAAPAAVAESGAGDLTLNLNDLSF